MNAPFQKSQLSRRALLKSGVLTVGFALAGAPGLRKAGAQGAAGRMLDPKQVDAFIAVNGDNTVTLYCGKVDLGTGLRISMRQILAEELGVPVNRIKMIEGDTGAYPRPRPHRRLERYPARRRANPTGRGDGAQGTD